MCGDQSGIKKPPVHQPLLSGVKRKLGFAANDCEMTHFGSKKSFTELSPSPSKRSNPDSAVSVSGSQLDAGNVDPLRTDLFQNFGSPDYPADPVKTGFLLAPSLNEKHEKGKLLFFQIKAFYL